MKILQVNYTDLAGRRFNGYDLMEFLHSQGHSAWQAVCEKKSDNPNVISLFDTLQTKNISHSLIRLTHNLDVLPVGDLISDLDSFHTSNLVHYHIIHNMHMSIPSFVRAVSQKPSIWSIHDLWAFTGNCIYPNDCQEYLKRCENCLSFPIVDVPCSCPSSQAWLLKEQAYKQVNIPVVLSNPWMYRMMQKSPLSKLFDRVHIIPFGIDLTLFSKEMADCNFRQKYGIPTHEPILFFRCEGGNVKGNSYILEALSMMHLTCPVTVLTCGIDGLSDTSLSKKFRIVNLGWIGEQKLRDAMSASTLFLMPSTGESFGLMAIEAMACQCPIIVFEGTALPETTFAPHCGFAVPTRNSTALCEAIEYLLANEPERQHRANLGRKLAEEHYDYQLYFQRMLHLYETILSEN